jgi:hypothetical protein
MYRDEEYYKCLAESLETESFSFKIPVISIQIPVYSLIVFFITAFLSTYKADASGNAPLWLLIPSIISYFLYVISGMIYLYAKEDGA